jgi:hypothetical protein
VPTRIAPNAPPAVNLRAHEPLTMQEGRLSSVLTNAGPSQTRQRWWAGAAAAGPRRGAAAHGAPVSVPPFVEFWLSNSDHYRNRSRNSVAALRQSRAQCSDMARQTRFGEGHDLNTSKTATNTATMANPTASATHRSYAHSHHTGHGGQTSTHKNRGGEDES